MSHGGVDSPADARASASPLGADFETPVYSEINERRWSFFAPLIRSLQASTDVKRVLDVGAGAGFFSARLAGAGFVVTAVDGREENVAAIRARCPGVTAAVVDVQAADALASFADVDLLFCAGLLYHLDNPVAGIRAIAAHPAPLALIETQLLPGDGPFLRFVEEGASVTQGLHHVALVPTRSVLVRLLALYGRPYVYETDHAPDHEQFRDHTRYHQLRRVFIAAKSPIALPGTTRIEAAKFGKGFHVKQRSFARRVIDRLLGR
jgi:SAM-dependent methyltransferase